MGEVSKQLLEDVGIHTAVLDATTDERTLNGVIAEFDNYLTHGEGVAYIVRKDAFRSSDKIKYTNRYTLNREDAIRAIVNAAGDDIIISATGKASRELYEIREENGQSHDPDFLTVGSMGHSSSIALGIALNQPKKRVWCIDGDGAVLMHMGAMAVIGANQPKNLRHVIINNTAHESVGGVPTVAGSIDIAQIAVGCGYKNVLSVNDNDSLVDALKELHDTASLSLLEVKCSISSRTDLGRPKERAVENKEAFIRFVGL
ncbi:hypothetical protein AGMMS49992_32710 [Clostridia bacterium]|nr:hypothetical protein AGMMS49992_32710 [Clostridia bacterium]